MLALRDNLPAWKQSVTLAGSSTNKVYRVFQAIQRCTWPLLILFQWHEALWSIKTLPRTPPLWMGSYSIAGLSPAICCWCPFIQLGGERMWSSVSQHMPRLSRSCKKLKKLQVNEKQWKRKIAIFVKTEKIAKIVKFAKFVESVKSTKCRSIGGGEDHN